MPTVLRCRGLAKRVVGSTEHFEFGKMETPAKRRRALLESNPLRNTRGELIAWPDGKFTRTLRPAVFRGPRNRFPDALKNSWVGRGATLGAGMNEGFIVARYLYEQRPDGQYVPTASVMSLN